MFIIYGLSYLRPPGN